jgi:hypothetical protein
MPLNRPWNAIIFDEVWPAQQELFGVFAQEAMVGLFWRERQGTFLFCLLDTGSVTPWYGGERKHSVLRW